MPRVLCMTLQSSLASWGVGGAATRPTDATPTWSAITGLVSAALGLSRDDERQVQLSSDYALAVQVERHGAPLTDYHTVQTPHRPSIARLPRLLTRADELKAVSPKGAPWTNITYRDYLCDVHYTVVLWPVSETPHWSVDDIATALRAPAHPLYLGRRSCPLAAPLNPSIKEASVLSDVLTGPDVRWDTKIPPGEFEPHHIVSRRDQLVSAARRTFAERHEAIA